MAADSFSVTAVNSDLIQRIIALGGTPVVTDPSASNAFPALLNQFHELVVAALLAP